MSISPEAKSAIPFPEVFARDAIIAWFRGEFAAANAIIDSLLSHLSEISRGETGPGNGYEAVFAAIHRRRMNWIPVLHMQKYFSIADVAIALRNASYGRIDENRADVVIKDDKECGEEREHNAEVINDDGGKSRVLETFRDSSILRFDRHWS